MVSHDLNLILLNIEKAGGVGVHASRLDWQAQQLGLIEHALGMGYIRRDYLDGEVLFSLTSIGFNSIGCDSRAWQTLKLRLRIILSDLRG